MTIVVWQEQLGATFKLLGSGYRCPGLVLAPVVGGLSNHCAHAFAFQNLVPRPRLATSSSTPEPRHPTISAIRISSPMENMEKRHGNPFNL